MQIHVIPRSIRNNEDELSVTNFSFNMYVDGMVSSFETILRNGCLYLPTLFRLRSFINKRFADIFFSYYNLPFSWSLQANAIGGGSMGGSPGDVSEELVT